MLCQPVVHEVGQVDDGSVAAVLTIVVGEIAALVHHYLPEGGGLDIGGAVLNVVAEEEKHVCFGCDVTARLKWNVILATLWPTAQGAQEYLHSSCCASRFLP